jgi:hypothetical protein
MGNQPELEIVLLLLLLLLLAPSPCALCHRAPVAALLTDFSTSMSPIL